MRLPLLVAALTLPALAVAAPAPPPTSTTKARSLSSFATASSAKTRVYVGVYLHDVTKFDQKDGVFDVDLELWAKWRGAFDPDALTISNAAGDLDRDELGRESDGDWHSARWRVRGTLRGEFPLQRFPFDTQTLAVSLELPSETADLVPDLAGSGIRSHFSVTGWLYEPLFRPRVSTEIYRSDLGSIANEGRSSTVDRVSFEVVLHRPLLLVGLKLFLPLLIILMVALLGLFLHPELVEARSSIGVTALLSCFAFQFTVAGTLPDVAYVTVADALFLVAYIVTSTALVASIVSYYLHRGGRERAAVRLDRLSRTLLPVLSVVPALLFIRAPSTPPPQATAEPLPAMERTASAQGTLRIGVTTLPTITGSPASSALFWDVVHTEPDRTKVPALVDSVPSVATDSLRFLAEGELEVSWRLRDKVRWSDGVPLVARDLQFGLEVSHEPEMVEARVVSPRELEVRYSDRISAALEAVTPYPSRVLEATYQKGGYDAVRDARQKTITPTLGPYRVAEWKPDALLRLEPNPHFVGAPPSIQRVEIVKLADSAHAVAAFERGDVDVLAPNTALPADARALRDRRPDAVTIRPSSVFIFLQPDLSHPLLSKRAVRAALLQAIDRDRMRKDLYGDEGRVADSPLPGGLPGMQKWSFDPAAARAALEREGAAPLELPVFVGPSAVDVQIAEHVVADLVAVGVHARLEHVDKPIELYRKRTHGGLLVYAMRGSREVTPRTYWNLPLKDGRHIPTARHDAYDDTIAALAERERRALYPERREQLRDRMFLEYAQRLPSLPLVFTSERMVVSPRLHGWEVGADVRFGEAMERWWFAPEEAKPKAAK